MISDKPTLTLPHRDPFVFVHRLLERSDDGKTGVVEYDVSPELDCFRGHFPGFPVFPGVLQMESVGQACIWIYYGVLDPQTPPVEVLFVGVDEFKFRKPVLPPATLRHHLRYVKGKTGLQFWNSETYVGTDLISKGAFWLMLKGGGKK